MIRLLVAVSLMGIADPALAGCHKFSIWHFPWPQRCAIFRVAAPLVVPVDVPLPPEKELDIPLPDLTPVDGSGIDEDTRAKLLLRGELLK